MDCSLSVGETLELRGNFSLDMWNRDSLGGNVRKSSGEALRRKWNPGPSLSETGVWGC